MVLIQQFTKLPVFRQLTNKELKKVKEEWVAEVKKYETEVLAKRGR